jgi:UDP-N-acetylglucosamine transferase subunit ALG13
VEIPEFVFPEGNLWGPAAVSTFVSVGNATQPFPRLLDAVCDLARHLPQPVFVQYGAAETFACPACTGAGFLDMDEFAHRVAGSDVLILHAGAGSVIHAVRAGKVPVVVPRRAQFGEHVDDHQVEFARELARMGKIVVCEDTKNLASAVNEALGRQQSRLDEAIEPALVGMVREVISRHARGLHER